MVAKGKANNRCDIRLKIHKYQGGEKSVQIRILRVQK